MVSIARTFSPATTRGLDQHAAKVERVVRQLRAHDPARPVSLKKRAVSHQVPKFGDKRRSDPKIDISDLDELLEIDTDHMTCTAEPGITFVDLVKQTLKVGLVPKVVPELKTITIGGAVAGCSVESMSFRYGGFHDSCLEYEVITAGGDVLRCTPENEHRLIFEMMHGTFGTLGILSKLKFELVPAKPYVHVEYHSHTTLESYLAEIDRHYRERDFDFMDGIIHTPDKLVLSLGRFVDRAPYTNRYDWMKVYYRTTAERREDFLETSQYFFRYDRGVTNPTPRSAVARFFFGRLMSSARLLRMAEWLHFLLPAKQPPVTLDTFIPFSKMGAFMDWYRREVGYFPLWVVPYRPKHIYEWIADDYFRGLPGELFLDIAIYGMKQPEGRNIHKLIEDELLELQALKTLISHNYYDEETFWKIWNQPNYRAVKQITDPQNIFRDLYAKTCKAAQGVQAR